MWIRSQNKKRLVNVEHVYLDELQGASVICSEGGVLLGGYESESRALEVLDQIHNVVARNSSRDYLSGKYRVFQNNVFEMPKE